MAAPAAAPAVAAADWGAAPPTPAPPATGGDRISRGRGAAAGLKAGPEETLLKAAPAELKAVLAGLKAVLAGLKAVLAGLKAVLAGLKAVLAGLKAVLAGLKAAAEVLTDVPAGLKEEPAAGRWVVLTVGVPTAAAVAAAGRPVSRR